MLSPPADDLLSKQGSVTVKIAKELLRYRPGDRVERARDYADRFSAGAGTIQGALQQLQNASAIKLSARGQLGTFIDEISYPRLYQFTLLGPVIGAMPLPYSRRYEGLATALRESFTAKGIDLNITFIRGSANRLATLDHTRCDFVVLSRLAVLAAKGEGREFALELGLGLGTWVSKHLVLLAGHSRTEIEDGMRVGVDTQSADHTALVERACAGKTVDLVELGYMQLLPALVSGRIDATVWNEDDLTMASAEATRYSRGSASVFDDMFHLYSESVVVVHSDQPGIANLVEDALDVETLVKVQNEVITGERLPSY